MAIQSMYPRTLNQYREAGVAIGKFVYATSGNTWTRVSDLKEICHPNMNVSRTTTGVNVLSFEPCRLASVLHCFISAGVTTFASQRNARPDAITETQAKNGSCALSIYDNTQLADPTDGAVLTVILEQAK